MQARFVCLGAQLMVLLDAKIGIEDDKRNRTRWKTLGTASALHTGAMLPFAPQLPKPA